MAESSKPRQRKFAPRSRQGCLTCRQRRKRCDNQSPQCANCTRLNLTCAWQPPRRLASSSSSSSPKQLVDAAPPRPALHVWDALPADEASERQHLLRYYVEAFVPSVSVASTSTPANFYTSLYMPWAFQVDGMLDAILAITSAQLARRTLGDSRAVHLRALSSRHQRKCYAFIKDRVALAGRLPQDVYQVAAVILILVGLEALNGIKTTRWIAQLNSVQRILAALPPEQSIVDCIEVDSLQRHFTYHFASASLMARVCYENASTPATAEQGLMPLSAALMPAAVDPLMGINYQLCDLISRIPHVTSSNTTSPHPSESPFNAIEHGIQTWTYDNPFALGVELPIALDLIALAEAYRLAALIQLYRISPDHLSLIHI